MRTELLSAAVAIIGLTLLTMGIDGGGEVLTIGLTTLALMYFPLGILHFNSVGPRKLFKKGAFESLTSKRGLASFAVGTLLAIIVIGCLFKLLQLPGSAEMLIVGLYGSPMLVLIVTVSYFTRRTAFKGLLLVRMGAWIALGVMVYQIPGMILVKMYFRNHPEVIEAYEAAYANPEDRDLWVKAEKP